MTYEFPTKRLNPVAGTPVDFKHDGVEHGFPTKRLNPVAGTKRFRKLFMLSN